jgi:hypothetical protein
MLKCIFITYFKINPPLVAVHSTEMDAKRFNFNYEGSLLNQETRCRLYFEKGKSGSPNLKSLRPFLGPFFGVKPVTIFFEYCLYLHEVAKSLLVFFYIELWQG